MIAVACGVGVAVTFASPGISSVHRFSCFGYNHQLCITITYKIIVGGVLYSIEIVSVFFSVRSYWHGFFAATIGALFWRLLTVWFHYEESITHIFKTDFRLENPYETLEIISFSILGILCGLSAYLFVCLNRTVVLFNRRKNRLNNFLQKFPLIYPIVVTTIIGIVSFPGSFGQFYASWLSSGIIQIQIYSQ